jgi:hypothetical protein
VTAVDITEFFNNEDPARYSASALELGGNAGQITWAAARAYAAAHPAMLTPEQVEAWKLDIASTGGWTDEERKGWNDQYYIALFVQFVAGDMREAGLFPGCNWENYYTCACEGSVPGNLYCHDGKVYYELDH